MPTQPRQSTNEDVNFVSLRKESVQQQQERLVAARARKDMQSDRKSVHYEDIPEEIPLMPEVDSQEGTYAPPSQQEIALMQPL